MKKTSEYLQLLKQFKETKAKSYGINKIGLFGSVARGEHKEGSDFGESINEDLILV